MAEIDHRDFFISFNSADLAYAEAIDAALRAAGFTTHFHPRDLKAGSNIPQWMDESLMASAQTLALYSPDYVKDEAVYSRAEHYATWWQDPRDDRRKLIPVLLRDTTLTPLIAPISRIEVMGLTPKEAAARVVERLKAPKETEQRGRWRKLQALPEIFRAPYRPNPNFTGRFEDLENLHRALGDHATVAVTAIAGTGGIGKTTLAAEYCHRFGGQYGGVWTVRAEESAVMLADLQELAKDLKVGTGENTEADAKAALKRLKSETHPWLLVYDNAPNPDAVSEWLPEGAVRCLITSRSADFGAIAVVTELDYWPETITADYLLSRTKRADAAGAMRLAKALSGLPLAAEQAATYLVPRPGVSFDDYAADIARLIKQPKPKGARGEYPDTVYAAFVRSLETLREMESGEIALDILRVCAFLAPDCIELWLLTAGCDKEILPVALAASMAKKVKREDAFAALTSLSLLRREDAGDGSVLIFHRLLLEVVRDWMDEETRVFWADTAVQLVNHSFPSVEVKTWEVCARLMPHVVALDTYARRSCLAGKGLDRLLNQAGIYLAQRGDREGALAFAQRSIALFRATRADSVDLAIAIDNMAGLCVDLDRLKEAEEAYQEALTIKERHLGRNDAVVAITLSNLTELYLKRKDFDKAEQLLTRVAEVMKAAHGIQSTYYGTALANLCALYVEWAKEPGQQNRNSQAREYGARALAVTRAACGERHNSTATRYNNMGLVKNNLADWLGAVSDMERAVAIMLSLDLAQHPTTQRRIRDAIDFWEHSDQNDKAARLRAGDISDLLPVIAKVETEHRAWVAQDPKNRHFGPPSPFAK
jgi:tetratricopeptide (TPR) repeat protein